MTIRKAIVSLSSDLFATASIGGIALVIRSYLSFEESLLLLISYGLVRGYKISKANIKN